MNYFVYLINAILFFLIARYEYYSNNDKTIIITVLAFIALLGLNLVLGLVAHLGKGRNYRPYYDSAIGLIVLALALLYAYLGS